MVKICNENVSDMLIRLVSAMDVLGGRDYICYRDLMEEAEDLIDKYVHQ